MYGVEKRSEIGVQFKYVALNERQWVVWLRLNVHPNDVEPRALVSYASTTRTAEQIKELKTMLAVVFAGRSYLYGFVAGKHTFYALVLCDIGENQWFIHPMHFL